MNRQAPRTGRTNARGTVVKKDSERPMVPQRRPVADGRDNWTPTTLGYALAVDPCGCIIAWCRASLEPAYGGRPCNVVRMTYEEARPLIGACSHPRESATQPTLFAVEAPR